MMLTAIAFVFLMAGGASSVEYACRSVTLIDNESGQPVVGIEDFAYDPAASIIYLSAYDRRAVDAALDRSEVPVGDGGIYRLSSEALESSMADMTEISIRRLRETWTDRAPIRPHGIALLRDDLSEPLLFAINRVYGGEPDRRRLTPRVEAFRISGNGLLHEPEFSIPYDDKICSPNDVLAIEADKILITNDHGGCRGLARTLEDVLGLRRASLFLWANGELSEVARHIGFANGVALLREAGEEARAVVAVAATREKRINFYRLSDLLNHPPAEPRSTLHLGDAPDNLLLGGDGALYAAALPNLFQYARFRRGQRPERHAPSSVYRIRLSDGGDHQLERIWYDKGEIVSGASAAIKIGSRLLVAAAYDERIALCESGVDNP